MTNKFELYKCEVCGNVIEILISGDGHPVCCGQEMDKIEVQNDNINSPSLSEKHAPVMAQDENGNYFVTVSNHPMEEKHYIMFVQTISKDNNEAKIQYFYPNQEAKMSPNMNIQKSYSRSYCNIHGLYTSN